MVFEWAVDRRHSGAKVALAVIAENDSGHRFRRLRRRIVQIIFVADDFAFWRHIELDFALFDFDVPLFVISRYRFLGQNVLLILFFRRRNRHGLGEILVDLALLFCSVD